MSGQKISLQELESSVGKGWAKALKVYAKVTDDSVERPKEEWMALLNQLKTVKTNIR